MDIRNQIENGLTSIGIEFGSTRIKAVLIAKDFSILAVGVHDWENKLKDGIWTYSEEDIDNGLADCFSDLMKNVREKYGTDLKTTSSIGISAMMHGYLAFDENDKLLVPFRTWRNTITSEAAEVLSEKFEFNIPQRWSVAHLYQAILNKEEHISKIKYITTLAGYVHWKLTGKKVIGTGDGSGMFPISVETGNYNEKMLTQFDALTEGTAFNEKIRDILPKIIPVGESAGTLTAEGAKLLDKTGTFGGNINFCPPEGDAETGMVATNSIAKRTGNVSAGTSIFGMVVLEKDLSKRYEQIDIVATPDGSPVAMVHCNNCSTDLDSYVKLFGGVLSLFGVNPPKSELYDKLYEASLTADDDLGGLVSCNYHSGEHVTGFTEGRPLLAKTPDGKFTINNLMRCLVYSAMSTLKLGMDILLLEEKISLDKIYAHGGLFKSPVAGQRYLAAALGVPVELMRSAGEGGAWGIAILADYNVRENKDENLADFLSQKVFANMQGEVLAPTETDIKSFAEYAKKFEKLLSAEKATINSI